METGISEMGRGEDPTDGLADGTGAAEAEAAGAEEAAGADEDEAPGVEHSPYGDCRADTNMRA